MRIDPAKGARRPLVSVVIPTYNGNQLLMETLETVFAQTFRDFEVVVVNDGSTDGTGAQLQRLADEGRIRLINQINQGTGKARNRGLDEARGKYVALLDHDDLWKPAKLQTQVDYLTAHPDLIGCGVRWANSTTPDQEACDFASFADADGRVQRPVHAMAHGPMLMSSSMMFDRERALGLRFKELRRCIEDTPFHLQIFARGQFGLAGDEVLMIYRQYEGNTSSQADYFWNGIRMLRQWNREQEFADLNATDHRDMMALFAHLGRTAWARQRSSGRRGRAWSLYLREFPHQVRHGRIKFLLGALVLGILPVGWQRRPAAAPSVGMPAPLPQAMQDAA